MKVNQVIVFKTPFYTPSYKEFYSVHQLETFLQSFDFMRPHKHSRRRTGLPEFELGTRTIFQSDGGQRCKSVSHYGPRFIVARNVRVENLDGNKVAIYAEIPMDVPAPLCEYSTHNDDKDDMVKREYREVRLHPNNYDAIIDLDRMKQLWPMCAKSRSTLCKFITSIMRHKTKPRWR